MTLATMVNMLLTAVFQFGLYKIYMKELLLKEILKNLLTVRVQSVSYTHLAINEFKSGQDFVYIHVEAPDECGHRHEIENKVKSIELIDKHILGPVTDYLASENESFKVLITPDHATPLSLRTHTNDPVPFMIYNSVVSSEMCIRDRFFTSIFSAGSEKKRYY